MYSEIQQPSDMLQHGHRVWYLETPDNLDMGTQECMSVCVLFILSKYVCIFFFFSVVCIFCLWVCVCSKNSNIKEIM